MTGVERISFLGLRTTRHVEIVTILRDCLGLEPTCSAEHQTGFELGDGTTLEIYAEEEPHHAFFGKGMVAGFRVPDFGAARQRLLDAGVTFVGEPQSDGLVHWQHFHLPDGTVAEIVGPGGNDEPVGR